ncbi:MAG: hypothetical protein ACI8WT_002394 [Clostridium sp.]|jgi:hypothetical protein
MKFRKYTLSIFLIMTLIMSTISSTFVFAADTVNYTTAVLKMKQFGILDSTASKVTSAMTRGQFAKAIVIADDLVDTASGMRGATIFPDITANSELSGYVDVLLDKGLIGGTADGKFHPEASITYSEICTIFVKLLGYADGDLSGYWPLNYLSKAKNLKITDDLTFNKDDKVTIRVAAVMFDRLLGTQIKSDNTDVTATQVNFSDSINLFTDCIVQDNSISYENLADNEVLTDKGVLTVADSSVSIEVGPTYRVKIEDGEITKIYGKVRETEGITVNTILNNVVYYEENSIEKSMTLPSGISYYYHGVQQDYASLNSLLTSNMSIIFDNNEKVSNSYAVITDPIYSTPQLAANLDPELDELFGVTFDSNTKIIKKGKVITKEEIKDRDVLYSVTDINGDNKYILDVENYIEGNITSLIADGYNSTAIKVDEINYNYSEDMDVSKLSSYAKGNLISIILGYDDKVVDVRSIDYKTGAIAEYTILGNYKTSDNLADNEVITDKGTMTYKDGVGPLEIGAKYQLYVDGTIITEIDKKENSVENYAVTSVSGSTIAYSDNNNIAKTMTLPKASLYYYHGVSVDYDIAAKAVRAYSSIVLTKKSDNSGNDYVVIIDANFGEPLVYRPDNSKLINKLKNTKYAYIYREANIQESELNVYDVVYFVSDIWDKNTFIYVYDKIEMGSISAFIPDMINPTGLTINDVDYTFSKYFNRARLNSYDGSIGNFLTNIKVDDFETLILGIDGKIVDIY